MADETVSLREHLEALRLADKDALAAAFEAAKEKSASHNDLIRAMERQAATMVTRAEAAWLVMFLLAAIVAAVTVAAYFNGAS